MKKTLLILLVFLGSYSAAFADHITGGEMYYTLTNKTGNTYTYHVVLKLYRACDAPPGSALLEPTAAIAIFRNNAAHSMVWTNSVPKLKETEIEIHSPNPCIQNPPRVCYQVGYYEFDVALDGVPEGYTISFQRCCRIAGIQNLISSNSSGATYTAQIPGTSIVTTPPAPENSSAKFIGADTVIVCAGNPFSYNFGAVDPDTDDSLVYTFCDAFTSQQNPPNPNPPAAPNSSNSYPTVTYNSPYSGGGPLGSTVNLDRFTGMITGNAPAVPGIYVVTVCVTEYRNRLPIAVQRKDLQIKVGDCNQVKASLPASFPVCDDFDRTFANLAPANNLVHAWEWDFGDGGTSTQEKPSHLFTDTGAYVIKLVVNRGDLCMDSATSVAYVYPGFFPGFDFTGICVNKPTQFHDTTHTKYGIVNGWRWDFGNLNATADTSRIQNPAYTYPQVGTYNVRLIVTTNKGCIDTVSTPVTIMDKPPLKAVPKDTLMCLGDQMVLGAVGNGSFSWTGPNIVSGGNTSSPVVSPPSNSKYVVQLNDNGCINTDTMQVRVISFVTVQAMPDTVICATDSVRLRINSDGLRFSWTPAADMNDPSLKNPTALPLTSTIYKVVATVGNCTNTEDISITLVPYPTAHAGPDTAICFDTEVQLNANIVGSSFTWSPTASLSNPLVLNPIARPKNTTSYVLTVTDVQGCPKPKRDTITVTVLPKVNAFAGRDTMVVVGQPLQFNAGGGITYLWSPATSLNHADISNPVGIYDGSFDSILYKVMVLDQLGCMDSAFITVKIFDTKPQIFVPTAFTPNGDGRNDVFRPLAVGISKFDYFRVYNRWGQLVFSTTSNETGWDGRIGGKDQPTATFVWLVRGTDYTGKVVFAKGTVTLIR